jgi:hypothetical protein
LANALSRINRLPSGYVTKALPSANRWRLGRLNKHKKAHARGMGNVLGKMGHLLQGLEGAWGEPIPHIQSLVIMKSGPNRGLPDDGIKEFWPEYPDLTQPEKENRARREYQKILEFGSRWDEVLKRLRIQPATATVKQKWFGKGGESSEHKALKQYVKSHPEIVEATAEWESIEEYVLPSLDEIDVFFKSTGACIAVEVKSKISDCFPADYERGLYQTIKYRALLSAMAQDGRYHIPPNIRSVLVLESKLPPEYKTTAETLGVEVIENVRVKE